MSGDKPRLWLTPAGLAFVIHALLLQVCVMSARVNTSYRAIELDVSPFWIGIIGASFTVLQVVLATTAGRSIDRNGARSAFFVGGGAMVLAVAVFIGLGTQLWALMAGSLLLGFGHLLCLLSQHAHIAGTADGTGMDRRFAHYTALVSVGQMVGPGVIVLFSGTESIPDTGALYLFALMLTLICLGAAFLLDCAPPLARQADTPRMPATGVLRMPGVTAAVVAGSAAVCAIDLLVVYLPVIGTAAGLPAATVAALLSARALASLGVRMIIGTCLRVVGRRWLISASIGFTGVGLALLGVPIHSPTVSLGIAVVVVGAGVGLAVPLTMSWLSGIVPAHLRGLALSVRLSGNRLSQLVVPVSFGALAGLMSLSAASVVVGVVVVAIALQSHAALARSD